MDWAHYLSLAIGFALFGIVYFFVVFWPVIRIMRCIGRSGWWSLLILAWPIGLWLFAYTRWPAIDPPKD
jgi:hypothetical protein